MSSWKSNLRDAGVLISTFGLAAFAAVAERGLTGTVLTSVLGGIFTNIASEVITPLLGRISGMVLKKHPGELNHDLQKLLAQAIGDALRNVELLYKEQYPDKETNNTGTEFLRQLRSQVQELLSPASGATITNQELQQYLYDTGDISYSNLLDRLQSSYIKENFDDRFASFFRAAFPAQLQICYAEHLKNKDNHAAWVAFQKMLLEDTREGVKEILHRQEKLEKGIQDLHSQQWLEKISQLSPDKTEQLRLLLQELNQPQQLEIKLNQSLERWLDRNRSELQELRIILLDTHQTARKTHGEVKIIKARLLRYLVVATIIVITLAITAYVLWDQQASKPFGATVVVHGKNGTSDRVLQKTGVVTLTLGQKTESVTLNEKGEAYFREISSDLKNEWVNIELTGLNGLPYQLACDTCKIKLTPEEIIHVRVRTMGLDSIRGQVTANGYPVPGAAVMVNGIEASSGQDGNFLLIMAEDKQELRQQVMVNKQGYKTWTRWVNSPEWIEVRLEK